MNNLDKRLAVFVVVITWKWVYTLEHFPSPILTFKSEDDSSEIIQNGAGSFVYLPFSENSVRIRVTCTSYLHDVNPNLQILKGQRSALELNVTSSAEEKTVAVLLKPDMNTSETYSCRLLVSGPNDGRIMSNVILYRNTVTARLSVLSKKTTPSCFTNKGNIALKNEFIMLWCVMPLSTRDHDHLELKWSFADDLLCTSPDGGRFYTTSLCVLSGNFFTNKTICGYGTILGFKDACSLQEIAVVDSQKLSLFPEHFNNGNTTLIFTCESEPPVHPLLWYVFTEEGIVILNDLLPSIEPISINIVSNSIQGSSILEMKGNTGSLKRISFVVCSTYSEGDGRNFNAISWAGLEKPEMISTPPTLLSEEGLLPNSSLMSSSSVPTTFSDVPNRESGSFNQTERVIYLIVIIFLFLLVLVLFGCLMRPIFIRKMNSKRDENVDDTAPPLQANPAYVGYNNNQGRVGNDVQYTQYTPDNTRALPYAVLQMSSNNTERIASVNENAFN